MVACYLNSAYENWVGNHQNSTENLENFEKNFSSIQNLTEFLFIQETDFVSCSENLPI